MTKPILTVQMIGMRETIGATRELELELRRVTNRELRAAAGECARRLLSKLRSAAEASSSPVARRVAQSMRVKSDRLPVVSIGGTKRVGRHGAIAAKLLWGSEHGPAAGGGVNHFAVARSTAGYWIAPTVDRFAKSDAIDVYRRAVYLILRRSGLV